MAVKKLLFIGCALLFGALGWVSANAAVRPYREYERGLAWYWGQGRPRNVTVAAKDWLKAMTSSSVDKGAPAYALGVLMASLHTRADQKWAVQDWTVAATNGVRKAAYNLAIVYYKGLGVPKDPQRAAYWAKYAADRSSALGAGLWGFFLYNGIGVPMNQRKAQYWTKVARFGGGLGYGRETLIIPHADPAFDTPRQPYNANGTPIAQVAGAPVRPFMPRAVPTARKVLPRPQATTPPSAGEENGEASPLWQILPSFFVVGVLFFVIRFLIRVGRKPVNKDVGDTVMGPVRSIWREGWDMIVGVYCTMRIKKAGRMGYLVSSNERGERLEPPALAVGCQDPTYRREQGGHV